eukprot:scaffold3084_cov144-Cylindrotheca_fusiformis.AAC.1
MLVSCRDASCSRNTARKRPLVTEIQAKAAAKRARGRIAKYILTVQWRLESGSQIVPQIG